MSDEKFEIGLRDVYNEVKSISGQLSAYTQALDPKVAVIEHRLAEVESDVKEIHTVNHEAAQHRHEERRHRAQIKWLIITSILLAVASLAGALIAILGH